MREEWLRCPHAFFRRHIQGLVKLPLVGPGEDLDGASTKSVHLHFGGALARGLEIVRRSWTADALPEIDCLQRGVDALILFWGDAVFTPTTRNEEAKTLANAILTLERYFVEWPLDDPMQRVGVRDGEPLVEFSGAAPIPGVYHPTSGDPLIYAGRFDAMIDRGKLWGLDDKTTGSNVNTDGWRAQWRLAGQFTGYTWLANQYGYGIDAFLIHGVQVLKTQTNFAEVIAPRPPWMVEVWLRQLQADVETMIEQYLSLLDTLNTSRIQKSGYSHSFPQALGHACVSFNHACTFLDDLCAQPNPDDWLGRFRVERWDPLRRAVDD
jgi:hypothetical protein